MPKTGISFPPFKINLPGPLNFGLRTGTAAQLIPNRKSLANTVKAAKKVKEPIAAKAKAEMPKKITEFEGVRYLL